MNQDDRSGKPDTHREDVRSIDETEDVRDIGNEDIDPSGDLDDAKLQQEGNLGNERNRNQPDPER
jgi:hypothetical protein